MEKSLSLLMVGPLACVVWNKDMEVVGINTKAEEILGLSLAMSAAGKKEKLGAVRELLIKELETGIKQVFSGKTCHLRRLSVAQATIEVDIYPAWLEDECLAAAYLRPAQHYYNMDCLSQRGRFCSALDIMPMACAFISEKYECIGHNREVVELFGLHGDAIHMRHLFELAPMYQADGRLSNEKFREYVNRAFESGRVKFEWLITTGSGVDVPTEITLVRMDNNNHYVVAAFMNDLRELKEAISSLDKISTIAFTDSLTGLYNRRYFMERLSFELSVSDSDISIVIFDLDRFKNVNDTYGHQVGDDVLYKVSERIKASLRSRDLFARYGGEEFIVMLLDTPSNEAAGLAERLRESVDKAPFICDGHRLNITISLGVATKTEPNTSLEQLIHNADEAMYLAKKNGRNRVEVF